MEILTILVAIIGMTIVGLLVFFAYRQGIIDGQKIKDNKQVTKLAVPKKSKPPVPEEVIVGYNNIMNYDGKESK